MFFIHARRALAENPFRFGPGVFDGAPCVQGRAGFNNLATNAYDATSLNPVVMAGLVSSGCSCPALALVARYWLLPDRRLFL